MSRRARGVLAVLALLALAAELYVFGTPRKGGRKGGGGSSSGGRRGTAAASGEGGDEFDFSADNVPAFAMRPNGRFQNQPPGKGDGVLLFSDTFLESDTLYTISILYSHWTIDVTTMTLALPAINVGVGGQPPAKFTEFKGEYKDDRIVIGMYRNPALLGLDSVEMNLTWGGESSSHTVRREPPRRKTKYAICSHFWPDQHLLRVWMSYWWMMGVGTFHLYYNNPDERALAELMLTAEGFKGRITWMHWPYRMWLSDSGKPDHAQPMALNDCFYRYRRDHEFMFFFDLVRFQMFRVPPPGRCCPLAPPSSPHPPSPPPHFAQDELLTFPNHDDIDSYMTTVQYPFAALRTPMTWTKFPLEETNTTYDRIEIEHLAAQPLVRSDERRRTREKYWVNTSHPGAFMMSIHGVHGPWCGNGAMHEGLQQTLLPHEEAYHFHFVNVGRDRSRGNFIENAVNDTRAMDIVRKGLARKGSPWKKGFEKRRERPPS
jgi:hypothetical protein